MANTTYMNLSLPIASLTLGPLWASQLNTAIESIDAHDHTSNKGKKVPTSGLNINANLDLNTTSPYNALSLKFTSQTATLTGASNASSIYVFNGNLYYTNSSGTAVQITSGASVVSTPGAAQSFPYTSINTDLTINPVDTFVFIETDTTTSRTITLPLANTITQGRIYIIKDASGLSLTNPITIATSGSDTIDGSASTTLNSNLGSISLISDGSSSWFTY